MYNDIKDKIHSEFINLNLSEDETINSINYVSLLCLIRDLVEYTKLLEDRLDEVCYKLITNHVGKDIGL